MGPFGNPYADWARFMSEAGDLYMESASVIRLRTLALMGGGQSAQKEAQQMVAEKIEAHMEAAQGMPLTPPRNAAAAASAALLPYSKRVRANHRRLSRKT